MFKICKMRLHVSLPLRVKVSSAWSHNWEAASPPAEPRGCIVHHFIHRNGQAACRGQQVKSFRPSPAFPGHGAMAGPSQVEGEVRVGWGDEIHRNTTHVQFHDWAAPICGRNAWVGFGSPRYSDTVKGIPNTVCSDRSSNFIRLGSQETCLTRDAWLDSLELSRF